MHTSRVPVTHSHKQCKACFIRRTSGVQAESAEAQALCDELGITVLPTVQFWKEGAKLWEHRGIVALQQNVGEGGWQGLRY